VLEVFVIVFHLAAIIVAAVLLRTSVKNRAAFGAWPVFGIGLIIHAVPSLVLLGSYPGGIGYIVAFFAVPLAAGAAILWMIVAACIAVLSD
jgi:hypothetical protein